MDLHDFLDLLINYTKYKDDINVAIYDYLLQLQERKQLNTKGKELRLPGRNCPHTISAKRNGNIIEITISWKETHFVGHYIDVYHEETVLLDITKEVADENT